VLLPRPLLSTNHCQQLPFDSFASAGLGSGTSTPHMSSRAAGFSPAVLSSDFKALILIFEGFLMLRTTLDL